MKEIQLTQGQVALVDDEDYERVNAFKWYAHWQPSTQSFYAKRAVGGRTGRKIIPMAAFIMNTPDGMICDHIDRNTLDNRKSNLRNCTHSQNMLNRRIQSNNTIGVKGVYRNSNGGFDVRIKLGGKVVYYKWFRNLEEAIADHNEMVKKYHGEFANAE